MKDQLQTKSYIIMKLFKSKFVVITVLFCILITIGFMGYQSYRLINLNKDDTFQSDCVRTLPNLNSITDKSQLNSPTFDGRSTILNEFFKNIQEKDFYIDSNSKFHGNSEGMTWISDDGWNVYTQNTSGLGLFREKAYGEIAVPDSFTSLLVDEIKNFFIEKGFTENNQNTQNKLSDTEDFILAYKKGWERCMLTIEGLAKGLSVDGSYPNVRLECSAGSFRQIYDEQTPLLKATGKKTFTIYSIVKSDDGFSASANMSDGFALFSRRNGNWEMIYWGQDQPSCLILQKYNFSKEVHDSCY